MRRAAKADANQTIRFEIPGKPIGKGRPRMTTIGGHARAYTPAATRAYEERVRAEYMASRCGRAVSGAVRIEIGAFHTIPASWSKTKRLQALCGEIRPTTKPDADNIMKIICDALNGIAWRDDAQVVEAHVYRWYSETPRVVVDVSAVAHGA